MRYIHVHNINKVVPSAQKCDVEQKMDTFFVDVILPKPIKFIVEKNAFQVWSSC